MRERWRCGRGRPGCLTGKGSSAGSEGHGTDCSGQQPPSCRSSRGVWTTISNRAGFLGCPVRNQGSDFMIFMHLFQLTILHDSTSKIFSHVWCIVVGKSTGHSNACTTCQWHTSFSKSSFTAMRPTCGPARGCMATAHGCTSLQQLPSHPSLPARKGTRQHSRTTFSFTNYTPKRSVFIFYSPCHTSRNIHIKFRRAAQRCRSSFRAAPAHFAPSGRAPNRRHVRSDPQAVPPHGAARGNGSSGPCCQRRPPGAGVGSVWTVGRSAGPAPRGSLPAEGEREPPARPGPREAPQSADCEVRAARRREGRAGGGCCWRQRMGNAAEFSAVRER